jgi:predicted O-methyltransferase YrrM
MIAARKAGTALSLVKFWVKAAPNGHCDTAESLLDIVFRYRGVTPIQVRSELLEFATLVQELRPKALLEIGTRNGGTFFVLCRLADPKASVISIDLPGGRFGGGYELFRVPFLRRMRKPDQRLHLLRADSHKQETQLLLAHTLQDAQLDLLFIDGDHTYDGVRRDFEMYSGCVRPGGMIAFHDIVHGQEELVGEVRRFWNEIKGRYRHQEIIENRQQPWGGIGVLFP